MEPSQTPKPLFWIGNALKQLRAFPEEVKDQIGFALYQAQQGNKHLKTKPLKGFGGAGVLEVVEDFDSDTYRTVYTVKFAGVIYVLHAFQKKSKKGRKTSQQDIELIKQRLKIAQEHHTAKLKVEEENRNDR